MYEINSDICAEYILVYCHCVHTSLHKTQEINKVSTSLYIVRFLQ